METIQEVKLGNTNQVRKPYHKLEVEQVLLIPEDNILGGCHTLTSNNGQLGLGCKGGLEQCLDIV